jgi:hypothetical protein
VGFIHYLTTVEGGGGRVGGGRKNGPKSASGALPPRYGLGNSPHITYLLENAKQVRLLRGLINKKVIFKLILLLRRGLKCFQKLTWQQINVLKKCPAFGWSYQSPDFEYPNTRVKKLIFR